LRILATADLHGIPIVYQWLVPTASCADVLILAGDLLEGDVPDNQRKQAQKWVAQLRESRVPVFYIMGNDDNVPLDYEDDLIKPLHGRRIDVGDYNFVGYQYTPPFVGDTFCKPEEEMDADLRALEPLVDEHTVFVTHSPAMGHLDMCFGDNVGSRAIEEFLLRKPVLVHLHGHIHNQFGRDGNHFNVAAAGTCRAVLIELPSLHHEVITYW
jgi:Icc-related predicted phosphoesterase